MRKIILVSALALAAVAASAQDMYDALRYSENTYFGTARSMAMGNAFTALGGDLGSIGINPAGGAVNGYSQFTLTPSIDISVNKADFYSNPMDASAGTGFDRTSRTRFTMPNFGMNMVYKTGQNYGLKSISFGFIGNSTAIYNDNLVGGGTQTASSMLGGMADRATADGYTADGLNSADYGSSYPWESLIAWRTGMIATLDDGSFIGSTEKVFSDGIGLAGALDQKYGRLSTGSKVDMVFNLGFNVDDRFYFGANLGLVSIDYTESKYFKEGAVNETDFDIDFGDGVTYFNSARYRQNLTVSGAGVYGKIGFIAVPVQGLRLGAAIQTPVSNVMSEEWQYAGDIQFSNSAYDGSEVSDKGAFEYRLISPWRANAGIAFVFPGGLGTISADYEYADYSNMKFKLRDGGYDTGFTNANADIKSFTGAAHQVRVGGELRLVPAFALRAGYTMSTSPEYDNGKAIDAITHGVSLGFGYSSGGSFFCDFALRDLMYPKQYTYPYADYLSDALTPEISTLRERWDLVATFGWRF